MKSEIFKIVFEDEDLLVIEKLRPFLSQKSDRAEEGEGLYEFISRSLGGKTVFPVHRLDREVLGLMVFGKTQAAAEDLSEQFRARTIEKGYEAFVIGIVSKESDELVHYLKKNPKSNYVTVFPRPSEGAKKAELTYHVLERAKGATRLFVRLKTGRPHQIRAQLAKVGHPVFGDPKYGKAKNDRGSRGRHSKLEGDFDEGKTSSSQFGNRRMDSIQLRSVLLGLQHPRTKEFLRWNLAPETEKFL